MNRFFVPLAMAVVAFALAPQLLKAADPLCPLGTATLHGTYIVSGGGMIGGTAIAAVGEITWDGQGSTTATYTASLGGAIHKGVTVTGTYRINPDCTGSHAESDGSHYDFVAAPDGNGTTWISTDSGAVVTGTTVRLKPVELSGRGFEANSSNQKGAAKMDVAPVPVAQPAKNRAIPSRRTV